MTVALKYLCGNQGWDEVEVGEYGCFVLGLEFAKGANGTGEFADAEVLGCRVETLEVTAHLGVPEEELEAECCGFCVNAVGAPDGGRMLEFHRAIT